LPGINAGNATLSVTLRPSETLFFSDGL